jgi:hypothetical protein
MAIHQTSMASGGQHVKLDDCWEQVGVRSSHVYVWWILSPEYAYSRTQQIYAACCLHTDPHLAFAEECTCKDFQFIAIHFTTRTNASCQYENL